MPLLPPDAGSLTTGTVSDPAAGADVTFQVPALTRWRVHSINFTLTTDATVATRLARVEFYSGLILAESYGCDNGHVASTVWTYIAAEGLGTLKVNFFPHVGFALPVNLVLLPETIINITSAYLQAGDQFSDIVIQYESWINP